MTILHWRSGWRFWSITFGARRVRAKEGRRGRSQEPGARSQEARAGGTGTRGVNRAWLIGGAAVAVIVAFWAYSPALHGAFLFDDTILPFALRNPNAGLRDWLRNVRPALYFTYWLNVQISKDDP